jgi:alcohol dehydrogenase class IV
MLPRYFEFSVPTRIVYGPGILAEASQLLAPWGPARALLVTDRVLRDTGLVERVQKALEGGSVEVAAVFDEVPPDSNIATVEACAAAGCAADCKVIIALGGGSVIDTAKVANILMVAGGSVQQHMGAYLLGDRALLPLVVLPTTAGTGSEVSKVAVVADPENQVKLPFAETQFLASLAILDPELTVSMKPRLTAATGMDALTHAVEAYVGKEASPASDGLALQVVRLVFENLPAACAHPDDLQARGAMLAASCLAGVAFSHSMVGMVHGIAHALGGVHHIPHGLANALILPEGMAYNLESCSDRYADLAAAMGIARPRPTYRLAGVLERLGLGKAGSWLRRHEVLDRWFERRTARAGIERVRRLNRQLAGLTGMPLSLAEAGVGDELAHLDELVTKAMEDGAMLYNRREPTAEAVAAILRHLLHARARPLRLPVARRDHTAPAVEIDAEQVFADSETLYRVLGGFFQALKQDPAIGDPLAASGLCVQFRYRDPEAVITIDARGPELQIHLGEEGAPEPEVRMSMAADVAHRFWLGKLNLITALTRRQVVARGNVPKTLRLLPILKPAFKLYPDFLRQHGLAPNSGA